jgi:hypothetical protein
MSSVARGNAFEKRIYEAIKRELDGGRLGFSRDSARLFLKKGYHSRDRNAEIIVDVSIELWLPSANQWSMLCVFECKDYSGSVPVDDVEEFKAKLDQIAAANRKGLIAISGGVLQPAALSYAKANGIGVVRLLPDDQVEHVLYSMTGDMVADGPRLDSSEFRRALTEPRFTGVNRDFYAAFDGYIFEDWSSLLRRTLNQPNKVP